MEKQRIEDFEEQTLTDPAVQEDFMIVLGEDGKYHRVEAEEAEDDGDASDD